ncbi:PREDICTED: uncharacterized protein LOC107192061 [Dufourea novaeangliae]|uniref:uncharacterized protein LOC107192061 n=1 Tax=Dufourea novaeangliae TaxID=178035 RepID=UPI000766EC56|nr:PREDICTED: uncharacterized protein LOC107192061 [Dufourea novaeangliae]
MSTQRKINTTRRKDVCAYKDCNNSRQLGHVLYAFPKIESPLCEEWISKTGNHSLKYHSSSYIRRMGVCGEHLSPEMFKTNPTLNINRRKMLRKNSVPEPSKNILGIEEANKRQKVTRREEEYNENRMESFSEIANNENNNNSKQTKEKEGEEEEPNNPGEYTIRNTILRKQYQGNTVGRNTVE